MKNKFIVIEGGEGSGKSTLIHYLKDSLVHLGHKVIIHREPGGSEFTEDVRDVFMKYDNLDPLTMTHLMNAQRQHNINTIIQPALDDGYVVISDRFTPSTLVYQGYLHDKLDIVAKNVIDIPQTTIFVDVDPAVGIQRIKDNNREQNYLDKMPIEKHQKINNGYHELEEFYPDKYWDYKINGNRDLKSIVVDCMAITEDISRNIRRQGGK